MDQCGEKGWNRNDKMRRGEKSWISAGKTVYRCGIYTQYMYIYVYVKPRQRAKSMTEKGVGVQGYDLTDPGSVSGSTWKPSCMCPYSFTLTLTAPLKSPYRDGRKSALPIFRTLLDSTSLLAKRPLPRLTSYFHLFHLTTPGHQL